MRERCAIHGWSDDGDITKPCPVCLVDVAPELYEFLSQLIDKGIMLSLDQHNAAKAALAKATPDSAKGG